MAIHRGLILMHLKKLYAQFLIFTGIQKPSEYWAGSLFGRKRAVQLENDLFLRLVVFLLSEYQSGIQMKKQDGV